jgi:hypothetical protein
MVLFQVGLVGLSGLFHLVLPFPVNLFLVDPDLLSPKCADGGEQNQQGKEAGQTGEDDASHNRKCWLQLNERVYVSNNDICIRIFYAMRIILTGIMMCLLGLAMSCRKENPPPRIPEVYVNFFLDPNSTEYLPLNASGGWVYVTGGYRGILIYRLTQTEFLAYERTCPYDPDTPTARIEMEPSFTTMLCPACKSRYIILDGTPFEGPSVYLLKQYHTQYDGVLLYVYN